MVERTEGTAREPVPASPIPYQVLDLSPQRLELRAGIANLRDSGMSLLEVASKLGQPPGTVKNEIMAMIALNETEMQHPSSKTRASKHKDQQIALMHLLLIPAAQIAGKLEMTIPAVKSRMQRMGLKTLKQLRDEEFRSLISQGAPDEEIMEKLGLGKIGLSKRKKRSGIKEGKPTLDDKSLRIIELRNEGKRNEEIASIVGMSLRALEERISTLIKTGFLEPKTGREDLAKRERRIAARRRARHIYEKFIKPNGANK